jgi:hypothetical protein
MNAGFVVLSLVVGLPNGDYATLSPRSTARLPRRSTAMLAYNLNCWLALFQREDTATTEASTQRHTTLATARLTFLFVAAKIWRHAGRTRVSYSTDYANVRDEPRRASDRSAPSAPSRCWAAASSSLIAECGSSTMHSTDALNGRG